MKSKNIFWGVLLISIGILWILKSLGAITFSWCAFFKLWPLIFVWIGIKLIPMQDKWKIILNVSVLLIGIAFLLFLSHSKNDEPKCGKYNFCSKNWNMSWKDNDALALSTQNVIKYDDYENAHLKLFVDAGKINFASGKDIFAIGEDSNLGSKIEVSSTIDDDNIINIKADIRPFKKLNHSNSYKYDILLNNTPVWDIYLELNATAGKIDLSDFKIKELEIESNAAALDIKIGNLYPEVNLKVESNASSVNISIPSNMKCELKKTESTLSSFNVKGLSKHGNNYVSDGENETAGVINITFESNVSSVKIKRY